jgi:hypothetical protein
MRANLKNNKSDQRIAESFEDSSSGGSSDFGESSSLLRLLLQHPLSPAIRAAETN